MYPYIVLGIDPGLVQTGLAAIHVDENQNIINIETYTITLEQYSENMYILAKNPRDARLLGFKTWFRSYLSNTNVGIVGYETPFYNMRRPNAFETLVEVCLIIRHTVIEHNIAIPVIGLSPPQVKKGVGIKGNSGKEEIEKRIRDMYPSMVFGSQHEMDALAVATCCL